MAMSFGNVGNVKRGKNIYIYNIYNVGCTSLNGYSGFLPRS